MQIKKIKPTLLNIASLALILWAIYSYLASGHKGDTEGWGLMAFIILLCFGVCGILLDFFLQRIIKNKFYINTIEIILLLSIWSVDKWNEREKTIKIPDNYKGFLSIVYNIKGAKPLYKSNFNLGYNIEIPEDGILFTSTPKANDLTKTSFRFKSGDKIESKSLNALPYYDNEISLNWNFFEVRTWLITTKNNWDSNNDVDTILKERIKKYFIQRE